MKSLRPLLPLVSVLGLGAAFFAGYEARGGGADEGKAVSPVQATPRQRPGAGSGYSKPFAAGKAEEWVHHVDDLKDLRGARLKMYVARECSTLDAAGAEELLSRCGGYFEATDACFSSEWHPEQEVTSELALDALTRLADLDLERAFDVLKDSEELQNHSDLVVTVLGPLAANDFEKVAEFLKTVPSKCSQECVAPLSLEPSISKSPENLLKLAEFCRDDGRVLGNLLGDVAGGDPEVAHEALKKMIVADPYNSSFTEAAGWLFGGYSDPKDFLNWATATDGADGAVIQSFAIKTLSERPSEAVAAADLYTAVNGNFPDADEREGLLRSVSNALGKYARYDEAIKWLNELGERDRLIAFQEMIDSRSGGWTTNQNTEADEPGYWLKKMPASPEKDETLSTYANSLVEKGEDARQWVDLISDPGVKAKTQRELELQGELRRLQQE